MKTFFLSALIGAVLVLGGFLFDHYITGFSEEMLILCEDLEERITSKDAGRIIKEADILLKERRTLLASILNHSSIDEIETCIAEVGGYISENDFKEAAVRCKKLKILLMRLPVENGISIQNIL